MNYHPCRLQKCLPSNKSIPKWLSEQFDKIHCYSHSGASTMVYLDENGQVQRDFDNKLLNDYKPFRVLPIEFFAPERHDEARKNIKKLLSKRVPDISEYRVTYPSDERCDEIIASVRDFLHKTREGEYGGKDYIYAPTPDEMLRIKRIFTELNKYPHLSYGAIMSSLIILAGQGTNGMNDIIPGHSAGGGYSWDQGLIVIAGRTMSNNAFFRTAVAEEIAHFADNNRIYASPIRDCNPDKDLLQIDSALVGLRRIRTKLMQCANINSNTDTRTVMNVVNKGTPEEIATSLEFSPIEAKAFIKAAKLVQKHPSHYDAHFHYSRKLAEGYDSNSVKDFANITGLLDVYISALVDINSISHDTTYKKLDVNGKRRELFAKNLKFLELLEHTNGKSGHEYSHDMLDAVLALSGHEEKPASLLQVREVRDSLKEQYEQKYSKKARGQAQKVAEDIAIDVERKLPGSTWFCFPDPNKIMEVM